MSADKKPAGVIFDFDGVVVDSLAVHLTAWKMSYKQKFGLDLVDTEGLPGRSTMAIAEILSKRAGHAQLAVELAELKREILRDNKLSIELLPGAAKAFSWLGKNNIPFGIASNAPRSFIESTLARLNIEVEHVFGSDDVTTPKPAPDVFLKCAKALSISVLSHWRTIVFEDSPHGLRAAVRAGMFPIGVLTQNTADQMMAAGAQAVCKHIEEAFDRGWLATLPT